MFNFFAKKSEQQIVAEIHNEFDTAEDRLLEQADNLLRELNIHTETAIEQRAATLKSLGFINTETVVQANRLSEHREKQKLTLITTREQAKLIRYYKQTYPFQKFLTETELERICEKYKLVFAPVKNYIKDVPEKNIKELERVSKLKEEDSVEEIFELVGLKDLSLINLLGYTKPIFTQSEIDGLMVKHYGHLVPEWSKRANNNTWLFAVGGRVGNSSYDCYNYRSVKSINKEGLFIAAPQSHFDLNGTTPKGKFSFLNITITEVKDPIVFRYVRGGVQVLSKWGLESQDEALLNEIQN